MGVAALKRSLPAALADESSELSGEMRELLCEISQWLRTLEQRIARCEAPIARKFKHDERCQRLAAAPGVGPLTATALVAAVGNAWAQCFLSASASMPSRAVYQVRPPSLTFVKGDRRPTSVRR